MYSQAPFIGERCANLMPTRANALLDEAHHAMSGGYLLTWGVW